MAWLIRQGEVLASLELASSPMASARGFAGRRDCQSAVLVMPARIVHTMGSRQTLDVAYLDPRLVVLEMARMAPFRVALPRRNVAAVLEAEAGAFERWHLQPGDALEVTE